jgi:reactive intermediate/imine deaminase
MSNDGRRFETFGSGKRWEQTAQFVQGTVVSPGPLIYLSGQVAVDDTGNVVAKGDLAGQTRQAFSNIRDLLEVASSSLNQILKLTYYVTDMSRWAEVAAVRAEFFPTYLPASTTVEVSRLHNEESMIEIEAIAVPLR